MSSSLQASWTLAQYFFDLSPGQLSQSKELQSAESELEESSCSGATSIITSSFLNELYLLFDIHNEVNSHTTPVAKTANPTNKKAVRNN